MEDSQATSPPEQRELPSLRVAIRALYLGTAVISAILASIAILVAFGQLHSLNAATAQLYREAADRTAARRSYCSRHSGPLRQGPVRPHRHRPSDRGR